MRRRPEIDVEKAKNRGEEGPVKDVEKARKRCRKGKELGEGQEWEKAGIYVEKAGTVVEKAMKICGEDQEKKEKARNWEKARNSCREGQ